MRARLHALCCPLLACFICLACATAPTLTPGPLELVLSRGRVMDPESGLDAIRDVGIAGGKIVALSEAPLAAAQVAAAQVIDAHGLVVAPGFIDLHAHGQDELAYRLHAADGVTSALELEVGVADIGAWHAARAGRTLVHYGASVGHIPVRMAVMGDPPAFLPPATARANTQAGTERDRAAIRAGIAAGLAEGAVAVGMGIMYTAAATRDEIQDVFREAARGRASVHVHVRWNGVREPASSGAAIAEVITAAIASGAPLHVVHVHSTSGPGTVAHLRLVRDARARGLDVTTECYPYTFGMTDLASGVFAPGWKESLGIGFGDLQWVATGERLDAGSFERYRKQGGLVAIHSIPEDAVAAAVADPDVIIASDGVLEHGKGHPRSAGTYARVLGHFVREKKALPLMAALRKMSLLPARRLEARAPLFRDKGRVRVGADADLVLFDPDRVIDRATLEDSTKAPDGIPHVLVAGVPVVRDGRVQAVAPGRALLAPIGR